MHWKTLCYKKLFDDIVDGTNILFMSTFTFGGVWILVPTAFKVRSRSIQNKKLLVLNTTFATLVDEFNLVNIRIVAKGHPPNMKCTIFPLV